MSKGNSPAFPCQDNKKQIWTGMNLRDYFALEAMNALIRRIPYSEVWNQDDIASASYRQADLMLTEREKFK